MGSEKLFRKDCTRVQFPIWLRGSVHISVYVLRRVAAGISSSLCIKRHSFGQFHSLTYINRWCWLLHKLRIMGRDAARLVAGHTATSWSEMLRKLQENCYSKLQNENAQMCIVIMQFYVGNLQTSKSSLQLH